jgi:hypothetical protein
MTGQMMLVMSLTAMTGATWIYGHSNNTWDRIG